MLKEVLTEKTYLHGIDFHVLQSKIQHKTRQLITDPILYSSINNEHSANENSSSSLWADLYSDLSPTHIFSTVYINVTKNMM